MPLLRPLLALPLALASSMILAACSSSSDPAPLEGCSDPAPSCAQGVPGQRCSDIIIPSVCRGRQWRCEGTGVIPASQCNGFGPPPPDLGIPGCRTSADCAAGEVCLFWQAGCSARGRCEASCPALDACFGCNRHCDCQGQTFDGCADRPFRAYGPCGGADAGPAADTGPGD